MSPASDPLLFIGSLLHSCVFPPSVLSNGDNKGDCRRIYLNHIEWLSYVSDLMAQELPQSPQINGTSFHIALLMKTFNPEIGIHEKSPLSN